MLSACLIFLLMNSAAITAEQIAPFVANTQAINAKRIKAGKAPWAAIVVNKVGAHWTNPGSLSYSAHRTVEAAKKEAAKADRFTLIFSARIVVEVA
jgi:hypothetical protein